MHEETDSTADTEGNEKSSPPRKFIESEIWRQLIRVKRWVILLTLGSIENTREEVDSESESHEDRTEIKSRLQIVFRGYHYVILSQLQV